MRLELNKGWEPSTLSFEGNTSEGRAALKMRKAGEEVMVEGTMPNGTDVNERFKVSDAALLGCQLFASYLPVVRRLKSLNVGESTHLKMLVLDTDQDLDIAEADLQVERKADSERRGQDGQGRQTRAFEMKDARSNASYSDRILVDQNDKILFYEREYQMSLLRFELIYEHQRKPVRV